MNRFSGDITPAFASGNRGMQPLTDEQERIQRLLEAVILKTPGGIAKSIGEGIQTGVDVVGSIGQLDKAEQLGRQFRRTLPDIVSAVTERPGAVASALGQGLEQDVLEKGLGAFVGVEDAVPVVGKAGKLMGGIGAAAMMSKMPKMSKAAQDVIDASKRADVRELLTENTLSQIAKDSESFDHFFYKTAGGKYDLDVVKKLQNEAEGETGLLLGDFIIGKKVRELYSDALNTPIIILNTPVSKGKKVDLGDSEFFGAAGNYKGLPAIFLSNDTAEKRNQIIGTILEEGAHTLRKLKGRSFGVGKEATLRGDFDAYAASPEELSAKKMVEFAAQLEEDKDGLLEFFNKATANVPKPAITDRGRRNVELAQEQIAAGETPGALVKAKIAESNAEIEKIRKEIREIIPEEEEQYRFNIILNEFKNGESTHQEFYRQLSNEFDVNAIGRIPKDKGRANKLYDLSQQENVLEQRTLDSDFIDQLDVAEKARLDRAVKQGFNIDAFHGTKGNIESFDPGLLGATTDAPSARRGFFFSADPETATVYADLADAEKLDKKRYESFFADENTEYFDAEINDRKERIQRAKSLGNKKTVRFLEEELKDFELEKKDYLERQIRKKNDGGGLGDNIMPVKLQITNPYVRDFEGRSYRDVTYDELLAYAEDGGHDGAIFKNTNDGAGLTDIYVVFDPSQIRSRFASFDPKDAPKGIAASKRKIKSDLQKLEKYILPEIKEINESIKNESQDLKFAKREYDKANYLHVKEYHENNIKRLIKKKADLIEASPDYQEKLAEFERIQKEKPESGDLLRSVAPILYPVGVGSAAAAYTANEE